MESDMGFQPSFDKESGAACFRVPFGASVAGDGLRELLAPPSAPNARPDAKAADSMARISKLTLDAAREVQRYYTDKLDSLYGRISRPESGRQAG